MWSGYSSDAAAAVDYNLRTLSPVSSLTDDSNSILEEVIQNSDFTLSSIDEALGQRKDLSLIHCHI